MTAVLVLLFFMPVAAIYGRYRARALVAQPASVSRRMARLLPVPAVILLSLIIAILAYREDGTGQLYSLAASGDASAFLNAQEGLFGWGIAAARWIGELSLVLFFLTIPYILGTLVAAVLLIFHASGEITLEPLHKEAEVPAP